MEIIVPARGRFKLTFDKQSADYNTNRITTEPMADRKCILHLCIYRYEEICDCNIYERIKS